MAVIFSPFTTVFFLFVSLLSSKGSINLVADIGHLSRKSLYIQPCRLPFSRQGPPLNILQHCKPSFQRIYKCQKRSSGTRRIDKGYFYRTGTIRNIPCGRYSPLETGFYITFSCRYCPCRALTTRPHSLSVKSYLHFFFFKNSVKSAYHRKGFLCTGRVFLAIPRTVCVSSLPYDHASWHGRSIVLI